MALKTMIENITKARENYEATKAALGENAQKATAEALGALVPAGFKVSWTQYTPYFNDGDACVFRVGECYASRVDDDAEERGVYLSKHSKYKDNKLEGLTLKAFTEISEVWGTLPEDFLKSAFGDHVEVTVQSGGAFTIDSYNHD